MSFSAMFQGFFMGLGLIMPIGAQNAYVLSQSIKRNFHYTAAVICMLCDLALMSFGVLGGGMLIQANNYVALALTWGGVIFLTSYGFVFFKNAWQGKHDDLKQESKQATRIAVILTTLTITLLNPHVYLDTIVIIGSISGQFLESDKMLFLVGTVSASIFWFFILSYGSSRLSPWLNKAKVQQGINFSIGVVMWAIAASLLLNSDNLMV